MQNKDIRIKSLSNKDWIRSTHSITKYLHFNPDKIRSILQNKDIRIKGLSNKDQITSTHLITRYLCFDQGKIR